MLVIVTNGPVENFNYNTQVLATSALCAQQQLMESSGDLIDFLQRPLLGILSVLSYKPRAQAVGCGA